MSQESNIERLQMLLEESNEREELIRKESDQILMDISNLQTKLDDLSQLSKDEDDFREELEILLLKINQLRGN